MTFDGMRTICARAAVVALVAVGASGCSDIPDWADPTNWVDDSGPSDTGQPAGETPDLASIPDRPTPSSTADEQKQVASSLDADRSQAKYSSDALRGGTEPAAPPPPPPSAVSSDQLAAAQSMTPSTPRPAPSAASSTPPPSQAEAAPPASDTTGAAPTPAPAATNLPPATPAPAQAASPAPAPVTASMISPSDAALGFKPSSAPPLDPTIGQFVAPPIVARYDQTASAAGAAGTRVAAVTPRPARGKRAVGGPDAMSGAVVANLDALQTASAGRPSTYANAQGLPPTSVVFFPGDGTLLNAEGRAQVRAAVEAFKQAGQQGYIRIVGHASSRTSNMPLEKHLVVIFNKSQDRANAVAKEVIREGVPANKVLVEAVGDSQPVYYESMPKGEDGNRRAEIFLQS